MTRPSARIGFGRVRGRSRLPRRSPIRRMSPTWSTSCSGSSFRIAQGDKAAYPAQLNQLKTIGAAIATASPETWKNKREADSLVIYILSGGPLADVAPLLKGDAVVESERSLARGALAYVTNHEADAHRAARQGRI